MPVLGKTKQEVLSEFRCSEILEAARRVFAKKGFSRATVEDIAVPNARFIWLRFGRAFWP